MNKELLKVGKGVNDVKISLKKDIEEKKNQTQTQDVKKVQVAEEKKVPETKVKDQYDPGDEIYYEQNDNKKNIAIFVSYSQEDDEMVNLKPTPDTKDKDGNPSIKEFVVNKANVIGAVIKDEEVKKEKSRHEDAADNSSTQLESVLTYDNFISLK